MSKRQRILIGMVAGMVWAIGVIWLGLRWDVGMSVPEAAPFAFLAPGLAMLAMIARLAQRRFFDNRIVDGGRFDGADAITQRVLSNTVEQSILALCLWVPAAILLDSAGVLIALGIGFFVARMAFWLGYHLSPPLRGFGFAASFYPTIVVLIWALVSVLIETS